MQTFETQFNVKFRSNIRAHVEWLEYMVSPQLAAQILKNYQSNNNLVELQRLARKVFQEEVYDTHSPTRPRTGNAKRSFVSVKTHGESTGIGVRSDPTVAQSKGPFSSGNPSDFSYAAFFEDPNFNSFLHPRDNPYHPAKFRPFMEPMTNAVKSFAEEQAMRATARAIAIKMPRNRANDAN